MGGICPIQLLQKSGFFAPKCALQKFCPFFMTMIALKQLHTLIFLMAEKEGINDNGLQGAKVVKYTRRGEFCKTLINMEEEIFGRRGAKTEKTIII